MEVRDAMEDELACPEFCSESGGTDLPVVVAGVGDDDLEWGAVGVAVDEEAVGLAAGGLVVDAHGLVDGEAGVDGVLAYDVPVAHPGGAVVADYSVVGEGSGCG